MEIHQPLLLSSSTTFENSSLIDNIHQTLIDLAYNPSKNEVQSIFEESISYLDKEIDQQTMYEIFTLIDTSISLIPGLTKEFLNEIYVNSKKNANRLILFASIFSQAKNENLTPEIRAFIVSIVKQIFKYINNPQNQFTVFGHEITPKYRAGFICDIVLMLKSTEKNVLRYYSYILMQKNLPSTKIQKIFAKASKIKAIPLLSEDVLTNKIYFKNFSQEDLSVMIPKISEKAFLEILPLIKKNFSNEKDWIKPFITAFFDKFIELDIEFKRIQNFFPSILDFLDKSMIKPTFWEYFVKYEVKIPSEISETITEFTNPMAALKVMSTIGNIPVDSIAQAMLEAKNIDELEHLFNYKFENKNSDIFGDKNFWIHIFSVISSSEKKYTNNLLNQSVKIFEKSVDKTNFYPYFEEMIFNKFPTTTNGNLFLVDLISKFDSEYIKGFDENKELLLIKISEQNILPYPSFWKIFHLRFIKQYFEEENNDPIMLCAFYFCNHGYTSKKIEKLTIRPLLNESSYDLLIDFIKKKDLNFVVNMNDESLLLVMSALIFSKQNQKPEIHGLTKETILPFLAIACNFIDSNHSLQISPEMEDLFLSACKYMSKSNKPLLSESLNSILSHLNNLANSTIFPFEISFKMIEILFIQLIDDVYKADKLLLLEIIFNLQSIYSTKEEVKNLFDKYGINLFKCIIRNKSKIDNFDKLKSIGFDLKIFNADKIVSILVATLQNPKIYEDPINAICFLEEFCKNVPELHIYSETKKLDKIVQKALESKRWNDYFALLKFISKNGLNHKQLSVYQLYNNQLSVNPLSINQFYIDNIFSTILLDPQIEKQSNLIELLFNILMNDISIFNNYFRILFEKLSSTYNIEPLEFLENYNDEYKQYGVSFINAFRRIFGYNNSDSEIFVRRISIEGVENISSKLGSSMLTKILNEANKKSGGFQPFFLLKNIASSFPFLFENNCKKAFSIVLPALDYFSLIFSIQIDSDKTTVDNLKKSLSAFYFLISSLYSVKVLDAFVPWVYTNILDFSSSQILAITYIMNSLFHTKRVRNVMLALSSRFNLPEIAAQLLKNKVPQEIRKYYKSNIQVLLINYYQMLMSLYHKKKLIYIDEMTRFKTPFAYQFNNSLTIFPMNFEQINLPEIKNEEIKEFVKDINKIRPFWIHYNHPKTHVSQDQINDFIGQYKFLEKNIPKSKEHYYYSADNSIKSIRLCVKQSNWVYKWLVHKKKFKILPEHDEILSIIGDKCRIMRYKTNDDGKKYNDVDIDDFFVTDFCQNELFNVIIKSIASDEESEDKNEFLMPLLETFTTNRLAMYNFLDLVNVYINQNVDDCESITRLFKYILSSNIRHNEAFKINFFDVCGINLIDFALSPEIRNNSEILCEISKLLCIYDNLPIRTTHIAGFMFSSDKPEAIDEALKLCQKIEHNDFRNIRKIIEIVFHKQFSKSVPSFSILNSYFQLIPDLIQSKKEMIPSILEKVIAHYNHGHKYDEEVIDLISHLFNSLTPKRKANQLVIPTNDESIDFSVSYTSVQAPKNKSQNLLQQAPKNLVDSNQFFWNLYSNYIATLDEIINRNSNYMHKFIFLTEFPELISFEKRYSHFHKNLLAKINHNSCLDLSVSRSNVFVNTFEKLHNKSNDEWLKRIRISFNGERGIDMGGPLKDWFSSVVKEIFNPHFALFVKTEKTQCYQPNSLSYINPDHIAYFNFIGKFIARALIQGQCVNAHFTRSFCRQILQHRVKFKDFEDIDKNIYDSMQSMLHEDVEPLYLNFTLDTDEYGIIKTIQLKEDGENIDVTNENKLEYISLYTDYRLRKSIIKQVSAFCEGFYSLIPFEEIKMFSPDELDLIICGIPNIDIEDFKRNTSYNSPYSADHPVCKMFFDVISKWDPDNLAKFLRFLTGSSQVPVNGFRGYREYGHAITLAPGGDRERYCVAHTCFNTLDLPAYESEEEMNEKLLTAILQEGFEIA